MRTARLEATSRLPSTGLPDTAPVLASVSARHDQGERTGLSQSSAAYESAARTKLRLGLTRLARAGNDGENLGFALTSLHAALEDHVRARLGSHPAVSDPVRQDVLAKMSSGWPKLVELLKAHEGLKQHDVQLILHANNLNTQFAHIGEFHGTVHHVRTYANFVQTMILGTSAATSTTSMSSGPARPRLAAAPSSERVNRHRS